MTKIAIDPKTTALVPIDLCGDHLMSGGHWN